MKSGYETSDVNVRAVLAFGAGLVAVAAVVHVALAGLLLLLSGTGGGAAAGVPPPEPRLQVDPERDMETQRRREEEILSSYGWVDRPAGTVRMPVDRAIDLVLERGLPTWK